MSRFVGFTKFLFLQIFLCFNYELCSKRLIAIRSKLAKVFILNDMTQRSFFPYFPAASFIFATMRG